MARGIGRASFSGHETFPFRGTWLKKAVDGVLDDPRAFAAEDAMVRFGVGKNMVASMRHWGLALALLEEVPGPGRRRPLAPTALGGALLTDGGWDPYLDDPGTLWLLHWRLARRPGPATTWWWVFNHYPGTAFTRAAILDGLDTLVAQQPGTRATRASLKRDLDVFLRSYAPPFRDDAVLDETLDCPLADLGLVRASSGQAGFELVRSGHGSLPVGIFAHALADYLRDRPAGTQTVTLEDLAFGDGAPGRVFCLDEAGLLRRLDQLAALTDGGVVFDETAGLKQIYVHRRPDADALLAQHYGGRPS